ncbi:MAG: hypothetical protein OXF79_21225 [Chloroflexi bacterium]|nr:hypothetical protein [Chloroflexota bacterium]
MPFTKSTITISGALVLLIGIVLMLANIMPANVHGSTPPERIAGFEVLDIRNEDNTECHTSGKPHIILRSTNDSHESLIDGDSVDAAAIARDLKKHGFPEDTTIIIAGPDSTKAQITNQYTEWNKLRKANSCIQFGGAQEEDESSSSLFTGRFDDPVPGYSIVVDSDIGPYTNHNGPNRSRSTP